MTSLHLTISIRKLVWHKISLAHPTNTVPLLPGAALRSFQLSPHFAKSRQIYIYTTDERQKTLAVSFQRTIMHFTTTMQLAVSALALVQTALVSANHYQPRISDDLSVRNSPFNAHRLRARDARSNRGSLRKRCSRKSSSQNTLNGGSEDDSRGDQGDSSSSTSSNSNSPQSDTSSVSRNTSTTTTSSHTGSWLKKNCVTWGWITDDGDHSHGSTGSLETPAQINSAVGTDALYFGAYAHIQGDEYKKGAFPNTYSGSWGFMTT